LLRLLRYAAGFLILITSLGILTGWWMVRRSLPQLEGTASLPGLQAEVTVERDQFGVPTITASSIEDLLVAQGYVMAQDRLWQMDILRRVAAGELAEIFGEVALASDRENRTYGFRPAAEASLEAIGARTKGYLEAYARGVNQYIEQRRNRLPWEFLVLGYEPRPWTPTDALLVHAYMYDVLTTTWRWELNRAKVTAKVGPERAREMFVVESPLDHMIVGGEGPTATKQRQTVFMDPRLPAPVAPPPAIPEMARWREDLEAALGSNNWVVGGGHTYSGKPILANDTHLPLQVPDTWYMVHLKAPGYHAKGFALPGTPLIVIGHNERIAWGFTNNGADVQDLYAEEFDPQRPGHYLANGAWVQAEERKEIIKVKGRADVVHPVTVTRHGPVVHREGSTGYALRWTALEKGGLGAGYSMLGFAQNWQEFLAAMRGVAGPAQNAVYADVDGNIGMVVAAWVPVRKSGDGSVPAPGTSDDFEWTGYIPFAELPQVLNPPDGVIATANARVVGPGYKHFLTDRWYTPYRTARIYELLQQRSKLRPSDCIEIQADIHSRPHQTLAGQLYEAAKKRAPRDARVRVVLDHIPRWDGRAEASSRFVALVDYTRRELREMILRPVLGEQFRQYQWSRSETFFENLLRERPAAWLPPEYPDYDALLVAAADRAAAKLESEAREADVARPENPEQWRWGLFVQLRMLHPMARSGFLSRHLSITEVDQSGTGYSVKQTGRSVGPAMRFVADLADLDNSLMNMTMGQSGQFLSRHYRDQFPPWYWGRGVASAFHENAVSHATQHRLRLTPQ
jgi:penicillin amidase